ncbi:hypothetical protein PUNSTDRAFT_59633 [Punctularia strigosozonata HHB-11173 SS5]|uniref:uncharacterized protein n=1 Tax=Punctularia strigosozonata (strain HHB-11173) TaxID=741275 RepID=UPI0004416E07|nr:uncharacterized protein PUNSTDRAFT_59633 [Punctularia strigosozonata HHB-11173 SS5]EIN14337.1 hypothetical protein PUNSTDRAFT_59633 [Punctularia strigosozonata HHB-11173 SS5]
MINAAADESGSFVNPHGPTLADLLTIEPSASIFYSYARETKFSMRFSEQQSNTTLLVPVNKAVMALARKPHQGPAPGQLEDGVTITEQEYEAQSQENVRKWVGAHIIPDSPVVLSGVYSTLLAGRPVSFSAKISEPDWSEVKVNGDVSIIARKEASNGVLYLLDGTIKLDQN